MAAPPVPVPELHIPLPPEPSAVPPQPPTTHWTPNEVTAVNHLDCKEKRGMQIGAKITKLILGKSDIPNVVRVNPQDPPANPPPQKIPHPSKG